MSSVTTEDIRNWIERADEEAHTHVMIVSDGFSYEYYPVYVMQSEVALDKVKAYQLKPMQTVKEVYDLSMDIDNQLDEHRSWNL